MNRFQGMIRLFVFSLSLVTIAGCDQSSTVPDPIIEKELPVLETSPSGLVSNGVAKIELQDHGGFIRGMWSGEHPQTRFNNLWGFTAGGIWIASTASPTQATASGMFPRPIADLEFWNTAADSSHLFLIEDEIDELQYSNWPTWLGAPSHEDGSLKRYGNSMTWGAFKPRTDGLNTGPLEDIRVGISAFVTSSAGYEDAIFLRYDLTNVGSDGPLELLTGHFSDLDVEPSEPVSNTCGLTHNHNQSAYDQSRGLAFVYLTPDPADANQSPACYGYSVGIGLLDLSEGGVPAGIYTNRIATRFGGQSYYPGFATDVIYSAENVYNALLGLDIDGTPMTNPITNQVTKFAFTGDPVTGLGWLDVRNDPRQLMSKPSFLLEAGETKSMIAVVLRGEGSNFAQAISNLKEKFDLIKETPSIWDY
jgi:hypothetical protein